MDGKKYHCISCKYEVVVPIDVLKDFSYGKFDLKNMPTLVCPQCKSMLVSEDVLYRYIKRQEERKSMIKNF